jgi:hypothetical protein
VEIERKTLLSAGKVAWGSVQGVLAVKGWALLTVAVLHGYRPTTGQYMVLKYKTEAAAKNVRDGLKELGLD